MKALGIAGLTSRPLLSRRRHLLAVSDDIDKERPFRWHLNRIGRMLVSHRSPGASAYLYDLTGGVAGAQRRTGAGGVSSN
jgi:hypothetical protein